MTFSPLLEYVPFIRDYCTGFTAWAVYFSASWLYVWVDNFFWPIEWHGNDCGGVLNLGIRGSLVLLSALVHSCYHPWNKQLHLPYPLQEGDGIWVEQSCHQLNQAKISISQLAINPWIKPSETCKTTHLNPVEGSQILRWSADLWAKYMLTF